MKSVLIFFISLFILMFYQATPLLAVSDPLAVPNNRFGIHIISASVDESSPSASLVNSNGGDWGYLTVLIESGDRNVNKWQEFFNDLRRRHLIPLVRMATYPIGDKWKAPVVGEEEVWADFLNNLNWPTKNRYVIIYNEPNHAQEWEGRISPKEYAQVLDKTISSLKQRSNDFFVLNAGFDSSTPHQPPNYYDELRFLTEMNQEVPGIFNKLDGWATHAYPNPGFVGSPNGTGRGTVRSWVWEQQILFSLGLNKLLPIFITETGWKHDEGQQFQANLPSIGSVSDFYINTFQGAWSNLRVAAVTPFVLSYQSPPFDHFSFKKWSDNSWYPQFEAIKSLPKVSGKPVQINSAKLESGEIYSSLVSGESYQIPFSFKNSGQSIWGDGNKIELRIINDELRINTAVSLPEDQKIEPGQLTKFSVPLTAPKSGIYKFYLQLYRDNKPFTSDGWSYNTEIKSPVTLVVKAGLGWKNDASGKYLLKINSSTGETIIEAVLSNSGQSEPIEARFLLPDYSFDFTLSKPFYTSKTVHYMVYSGTNTLEFGSLQPNIFSVLLNPQELWNLLPFSNKTTQPCELATQPKNC